MCGLAGVAGQEPIDGGAIRAMSSCLAHRGPDDRGFLRWMPGTGVEAMTEPGSPAPVQFAHTRLAIIDLTPAGRQPMSSPDGRWSLVFNGEIYNYLELRAELEAAGCRFSTRTDTEVLLQGIATWGQAVLPRLIGMFAFAAWDAGERRLLLARDFAGIKPLFYARHGGALWFASEIKALLAVPGLPRRADAAGVRDYLRYGRTDHTETTCFAGIGRLPPGCLAVYDPRKGELRVERWWRPEPVIAPSSAAEAAERVRDAFLASVRLHLRSDVPVGAALSGGVDSSAIVMAMRRVEPGLRLHTFSYVAEDEALNEEPWAAIVAEAAGAERHLIRVGPQELVDDLDHLVALQDEPFGSTSIYAQYRVFRAAREAGITVMLDGQGADEMLGGYAGFLAARLASLLRSGRLGRARRLLTGISRLPHPGAAWALREAVGRLAPGSLRPLLRSLGGRHLTPAWMAGHWFRERGAGPREPDPITGPDRLRGELAQAFAVGLPQLLRYEDRNSMAHGIESRVPFLVPDLARLILSLPEDQLIDDGAVTKSVFRRAMRGIVPDAILDRRDKIGFATPEQRWLTTLAPWVDEVLAGDALVAIPALVPAEVRRGWEAVKVGQEGFDFRIWRWINLVRWSQLHRLEWN